MKYILPLLFSFIIITCRAQTANLDWVKTYGSTSTETAKILQIDSDGNLFIVGNFMDTVDFDPGPGVENRISNGGNDIYILKLNSAGDFLWVRTFGNYNNDLFGKAKVDKMDNIVVSGHFQNSVDFDPGANVDLKTSNAWSDVYILKLDNSGNYLWTKTFGGQGHDVSRGLSINSTNDITVAGNFLGTVDFDPGSGVVNKSALSVDIYILQLNAAGNFNWVKTLEGPLNSSVQVNDLMFDKNDNLLMDASYRDTIDVDPGPNIQYLIDTDDPLQYNLFILKLDANGNYVWAKQFKNTVGNSVGISILSYDSSGNYYLGGFFFGNVDFDFGPASFNITTPLGASYILKIDSNANFIWIKHMGGFSGQQPEYETVFGIAIDNQSNVSLCGSFKGYEDFDPGPGVFYLGNPSQLVNTRGYIMQLDSMGNLNWAKNISDEPAAASVNGIALNDQGEIYVVGDFYGNTDFDFNAGIYNVMVQGVWDAFVLKIDNCGIIDTSIVSTGNSLKANASGVTYQWVNCATNFTPLAGETNQLFTPGLNGTYAVVISDGSCNDTSSCYSFITLALDNIYDNNISVYPNPSNGQVNILTDKQLTLRLYNTVGQQVLIKNVNNTQVINTIELNNFSKGLYLYELTDKIQVVSRGKLILD